MLLAPAQGCSWERLLAVLQCPKCGKRLEFQHVEQNLPFAREYGVLSCGCGRYPVVDGVPILKSGTVGSFEHSEGHVEFEGPGTQELTSLVLARRGLEALMRCIAFPVTFRPLARVLPRSIWHSKPVQDLLVGLRRRQLRAWCLASRHSLTAEDWFDVFCGRNSPVLGDAFSYFLYRLGHLHHLSTLALTSRLPANEKPVLDIACGFGHLGHNLAESPEAHAAVGVDRNFFQVWTAQYWVAPKSRFVCADADHKLPFTDAAFSAVLCADAFHYLRRKDLVLSEMARCTAGGPVLLTGVGNRLVPPTEGSEHTPKEYLDLCNDSAWRVLGEDELRQSYLRREPLDLLKSRTPEAVNNEKWLFLVYPGVASRMIRTGRPHAWPHAVGRLTINPLYRVSKQPDNTWRLRFTFPSRHYAFENAEMVNFCPPEATLTDEMYRDVNANVRSPEVERLIEQMVIIGTPEHYVRTRSS